MPATVKKPALSSKNAVKFYLLFYNLLSFALWLRVFLGSVLYLCRGASARKIMSPWLANSIKTYLPAMVSAQSPDYTSMSPIVAELLSRASTLHDHIAPLVVVTQSLAVFEFIHAALGLVKSNPFITAIQVLSRLIVVWLVSEKYESAAHSPYYATLILAWSLSEVGRYPFYVNQLLNSPSFMALWARYSFFVILYPLGVFSELQLIFASLPHNAPWPWVDMSAWSLRDLFFLAVIPLYGPGLIMLYSRLLASRRKVLGNDFIGSKGREEMRKIHEAKLRSPRQRQN